MSGLAYSSGFSGHPQPVKHSLWLKSGREGRSVVRNNFISFSSAEPRGGVFLKLSW